MAYTKYSLTPADNNAAPPNGAPEGMLPSAVNDTMRDMMSQIRDVGDGIRGGTYTMTAPVITGGSITGVALSGNTLTNPVITGGSINNTPIGASTANTGAFTTLGASGVATFSAGTVSAPAITTTGDTNTGIFFPAADTIAFTEGGVEGMRINSSGNVGIGTTSPTSVVNGKTLQISALNRPRLYTTSTGSNAVNTFFGSSDDLSCGQIDVVSNHPLVVYTNDTERMRITSNGEVCIGTTSTTATGARLTLRGTQSWAVGPQPTDSTFYVYNESSQGVYITNGGTSWASSSDERFKTNLKPIENAIDKVSQLRSVTGRYKNDKENVSRAFLIAQDVQKVLPEAVDSTNPNKLGVAYTDVIPLLVAAIKELKAEIDQLKGN